MRARKLLELLTLLAALLLAPLAHAQATHIAATLVPERGAARPGETILLAIAMKPDAGWHGYWENGGDAGFGRNGRILVIYLADVTVLRSTPPATQLADQFVPPARPELWMQSWRRDRLRYCCSRQACFQR